MTARADVVASSAASSAASLGEVATVEVLLAEHALFVGGLGCQVQAKYLRRRGAETLLGPTS